MSGSCPGHPISIIIWDSSGFPVPPVRRELLFPSDTTVAQFRNRVCAAVSVHAPYSPEMSLPYWAVVISCMPGDAWPLELMSGRLPPPNTVGRIVARVSLATWLPTTQAGRFGIQADESQRHLAQILRRNSEVGALLLALLPRLRSQRNARDCGSRALQSGGCASTMAKLPLDLLKLIYRLWRSSGGGVDARDANRLNSQLHAEKLERERLAAAATLARKARMAELPKSTKPLLATTFAAIPHPATSQWHSQVASVTARGTVGGQGIPDIERAVELSSGRILKPPPSNYF
jgi:hypothetical protein